MHRCAVYLRVWEGTVVLPLMEEAGRQHRGSTHVCTPVHSYGQIQWCARAGSHQLMRANSRHLFPTPCLVSHGSSPKLAIMGVCTAWKSANTTNQDFLKKKNHEETVINDYQHMISQIHSSSKPKPIAAALVTRSQIACFRAQVCIY